MSQMSKFPFFRKFLLAVLEKTAQFIPIPDKMYLRMKYLLRLGKILNLKNPQTFNEKIQWLKLNTYKGNPLVNQCADKYRVRDYVENCGCGEILNELYGVYDCVDDVPWDELPDQFVLKWNLYL